MVRRAVATAELAPLMQESGFTVLQLVDEVTPKIPDFLSVAGDSVVALKKAEAELNALRMQRDQQYRELDRMKAPLRAWMIQAVACLIAALAFWIAALVTARGKGTHLITLEPYKTLYVAALLGGLLLVLLGSLRLWQWRRVRNRYNKGLAQVIPESRITVLAQEFAGVKEQLRKQIYEQGVRPEVSGILGRATTPLYTTRLGHDFTSSGLAEVFVSGHEVETQARRDLDDLLRLPGGSIGLAGARGAGKTTLMTLVARRPGPRGKACYVMCPAPVEYTGRDFLLTLFLLLCNWVLEDRGAGRENVGNPARDPITASPGWTNLIRLLPWMARYFFFAGMVLFLSGTGLAYYFVHQQPAAVVSPDQSKAKPASDGAKTGKGAESEPKDSPTAQYLKLVGFEPARLVWWGLGMMSVWYLIRMSLTRKILVQLGVIREDPRYAPEIQKMDELVQKARVLRESLRFQQSYTSGWSGSLKIPIGLEGGMNDARSFSRNQRSLPELVGEFRDFAREVGMEYGRVTIGIDELDKMESDDKAHLFLNEVKAVFGVPNVYYLISVSENAISAFERRGLPFRDVFDSSFDAIVHVDYLNLEESKDLLKRRTTRLPEPFLCLCHCMSGGLPRDLIRACREMLDVAREEGEFELMPLARQVMMREARGKARGMSIAVSKLTADADQTMFLGALTELLTRRLDETELMTRAALLVRGADDLRERAAKLPAVSDTVVREQVLQLSALAELETEFGLYLAYAATVLEVMLRLAPRWPEAAKEVESLTPVSLQQATSTIELYCDKLAEVRQALAISVPVGRGRLTKLRSEMGMTVEWMRAPRTAPEDMAIGRDQGIGARE